MDCNQVTKGMRVKIGGLRSTRGMTINPRHLNVRKEGITGTIQGWVPGHGGDVWWVQHDNSQDVGAYCVTEMEPASA